jgi:hypothetical protein
LAQGLTLTGDRFSRASIEQRALFQARDLFSVEACSHYKDWIQQKAPQVLSEACTTKAGAGYFSSPMDMKGTDARSWLPLQAAQ